MVQPMFHRQRIATFAGQMRTATMGMLKDWRAVSKEGRPLDVASEMMRLTYAVVCKTLFNMEEGVGASIIESALQTLLSGTFQRLGKVVNLPLWLPTIENRRFKSALRSIDAIVYQIIEQHRANKRNGVENEDLLSMLMSSMDDETGAALSDEQLRNETITFLLAGHETTANALAWTFYLLSQHPEAEERLREELDQELNGNPPELEDLPRLVFLKMVIKEALRLYPPIWIIERRVLKTDSVGGYTLPAGSSVVICPYTLHRHPGFWKNPDLFQPLRFADETPAPYMPFGRGPRYCIGNEFAMLEAQMITAMVIQTFHLELVAGYPVKPDPGITLRCRHGLPMTLKDARQ